jgi:hypothetical protein
LAQFICGDRIDMGGAYRQQKYVPYGAKKYEKSLLYIIAAADKLVADHTGRFIDDRQ